MSFVKSKGRKNKAWSRRSSQSFSKVVVAIYTLPFPRFWELHKSYKMSVPNRFESIEDQVDNLCFLCLKVCSDFCEKCGLAYCCLSHYNVHAKNDYCYPFKVLQKPGVRLHSLYDLRLIAKFILASVIFKRNNVIFIKYVIFYPFTFLNWKTAECRF